MSLPFVRDLRDEIQKAVCGSNGFAGANSPAIARSCKSKGACPICARLDNIDTACTDGFHCTPHCTLQPKNQAKTS